jgi:multiple sugar transport system permease protein
MTTSRLVRAGFLMPAIVLLLVLAIFPFVFTVMLAFGRVSLVGGLAIDFGTLRNWTNLLTDERFWNAARVTVTFIVASVAVQYVLGLSLAMLVNRRLPGIAVFRVLFIVPMALTPIAIGYMWRMLFNESFGPLNDLLGRVGLSGVPWLSQGRYALASLIAVDVWHWTPFVMILLLAGLQSLPQEVLEAATVDGATPWQRFRLVIFPMLVPTSLAAIVLRALEAAKILDEVYILTGGGPGTSTESLTLYAYSAGLQAFDLAYGATIAIALFLGVLILTVVFLASAWGLTTSRTW